ncbi:DUF4194 domain-containing protein [Burkholderia ambifaria]|jgi:hypothetical protein|uniref:DUF4194 domain-containing protein n=1 Tax=Burkholderia ambifaria TaxID=152480 RepID=UPI001BA35E07|nr:DUF4194 domain-containing protein [Burkholderia ambifaria]MBR8221113.1 DUF4194 domain-containing protein [Burkholderia ambifaria]
MTSISKRQNRQPVFRRMGGGTEFRTGIADAIGDAPEAGDLDRHEELPDEADDESHRPVDGGQEKALFEGDSSTLPYDVRRAYALLLRGPSIDERHSRLWPVLIDHEPRLRQLLHAAFLDLVIDREQKVAFARPVYAPELDVPQLLREVRLTFVDSALVLFLRMELTLAEAEGRRATISRSEMVDHLKAYEASDIVDRVRFSRQVEAAIEKAKKYNFLRLIRNSGDRFEVSPALKLVFSHEQISELSLTYRRIREQADGRPAVEVDAGSLPSVDEPDEFDEDSVMDGE